MRKNRIKFLIAELVLAIIAVFFIHQLFRDDIPQKKVAVIIQNSGSKGWDSLIKGMKTSAKNNNLHLIICNTDEIETAQDEKALIDEQIENGVDSFIICPAPGEDTVSMLSQLGDTPFVLITQDAYIPDGSSGFVSIKPDSYEMGYTLGKQLIEDDPDGLSGKSIGIIYGYPKSEAGENCRKGLKDAIENSGCVVSWEYGHRGNQNVCDTVNIFARTDYVMAMDTYSLEQLGEKAEDGKYNGTEIYGMGTSEKSLSLLDLGKVKCLIVPDGYEVGYSSVNEIAKSLDSKWYVMKNHEIESKLLHQEDLAAGGIERFLYSYE